MAIRPPRRLRPVITAVLAIGLAVVVVPTVASATPDNPAKPQTVASVQKQLGELALSNSQLVEKFDQAQIAVQQAQKDAKVAQKAAVRATAAYEKARVALGAAVTAQYEGGAFSTTGALLSSHSGASYLDSLNTLSMWSAHTSSVLGGLAITRRTALDAQKKAKKLLSQATAKRDVLATHKHALDAQIAKYEDLLGTLTAAQRAAFRQQQTPAVAVPTITPKVLGSASAAARKAVQFALAQVGKPYVYGAAGPASYDCSGLTMAAWAAAGVSLPHSAADQYNYGHHVSLNALLPGDLIFMYSPIGHVTIYIGNGLMVSAPQTGENVSVIPVSSQAGETVGATRLV